MRFRSPWDESVSVGTGAGVGGCASVRASVRVGECASVGGCASVRVRLVPYRLVIYRWGVWGERLSPQDLERRARVAGAVDGRYVLDIVGTASFERHWFATEAFEFSHG